MADYDFAPRVCSRAYNCVKGILVFLPHPFPDILISGSSSGIFLLFIIWYISTIPGRRVRVLRPGDASAREMRPSG